MQIFIYLSMQNIVIITQGENDIQIKGHPDSHPFKLDINYEEKEKKIMYPIRLSIQHDKRSIYLNRPRPDPYHPLQNSREACDFIDYYYGHFKLHLVFPLVEPFLEELVRREVIPDQIWWVVTDQEIAIPKP